MRDYPLMMSPQNESLRLERLSDEMTEIYYDLFLQVQKKNVVNVKHVFLMLRRQYNQNHQRVNSK